MRKRIPKNRTAANKYKASKTGPQTGDHCPFNGWWAPAANPTDGRFISEGSLMPSDGGASVNWVLLPGQMVARQEPKYHYPKPGLLDED